jgi:hypothetical protein
MQYEYDWTTVDDMIEQRMNITDISRSIATYCVLPVRNSPNTSVMDWLSMPPRWGRGKGEVRGE